MYVRLNQEKTFQGQLLRVVNSVVVHQVAGQVGRVCCESAPLQIHVGGTY